MRVARYLCAIAVLLAACTTATTGTGSSVSPAPTSVSVSPSSTSPTPTPSNEPEPPSVNVPDPSNMVAGYGSLWVRSGSDLWQISSRGAVVSKIRNVFSDKLGAVGLQNLAVGVGSVWTVQPRTVLRIDPSTARVVARVETARGCDQITAGADEMFLGCRDSRLFGIDPDTNRASPLTTVGVSPIGIGYGDGSVWWINASEAGDVSKIDPSTGAVTTIAAPYARFVLPTKDRVWFVDANGRAFSIDTAGGRASRPARKARVAIGAAVDHGTVLINDGDLVAFDVKTGDVTQRAHVSGKQSYRSVAGIAALGSNIWLVDPDGRIVAVPR